MLALEFPYGNSHLSVRRGWHIVQLSRSRGLSFAQALCDLVSEAAHAPSFQRKLDPVRLAEQART